MPALSYKERFCPYVKDYSKTQSIRAFRRYPFRPGQVLSHFFGMRTKHCVKLIPDTVCKSVETVYILKNGKMFIGPLTYKMNAETNIKFLQRGNPVKGIRELTDSEKETLAYNDGFRFPQDDLPIGSFDLMFEYWTKLNHSFPFTGQLIKWDKPPNI